MATVRWTSQARADLGAVRQFLARESPRYAEAVEDGILAATERLGTLPRSGRAMPEVADEAIREMLYRDYRIVDDGQVDVLTVFHSARSFGSGELSA